MWVIRKNDKGIVNHTHTHTHTQRIYSVTTASNLKRQITVFIKCCDEKIEK
jgi:hypothetical protein